MDLEYRTCLCVLSEDNFLRKYFLHPLCKDFEVDLKEKFEKLQQHKNKQHFDDMDSYFIMNVLGLQDGLYTSIQRNEDDCENIDEE